MSSSLDDLLLAIDSAAAAVADGKTRRARRQLQRARALAVLLVPAAAASTLCPECEVGGGLHAEDCALAIPTFPRRWWVE